MNLDSAKTKFSTHVKDLQNQITEQLKIYDPTIKLTEDIWSRNDFAGNPGGGGITRYFEGDLFESAGVNTSEIFGKIDPKFSSKLTGDGDELWATGISLIIHPRNPRVPTVHANFRMIQHGSKHWFGGGADLTPFYPYKEDFKHFHGVWKKACANYNCYKEMKKTCDEYFVNKHRDNEMRGVGGLFFDHLSTILEDDFKQVTSMSNYFIESYFPIVDIRKNEKYSKEDEEFMLYRRSRYVEFNLIHDRGTLFGLKTNGRIKSIFVSLPRRCSFHYDFVPEKNSPYDEMNSYYRPQAW